MESNKGQGKLDEQARKRVEAVLQSELNTQNSELERIKSLVRQELGREDAQTFARVANDRIFIGFILDGEPVGVYV